MVNFDFRVDLSCFYFENMLHNFLLRKKWFLYVYLCIYFVSVVSIEYVSLNCKKWLKNNSKTKKKRKRYRLLATSFFYNWNGININWGISLTKLLLDGNKQNLFFSCNVHFIYTWAASYNTIQFVFKVLFLKNDSSTFPKILLKCHISLALCFTQNRTTLWPIHIKHKEW